MQEFERELRQALERRPAPPSLKGKIVQARRRRAQSARRSILWQRLAASLALAAMSRRNAVRAKPPVSKFSSRCALPATRSTR